ncbi:potassium-transporting ATPase subunit C [Chryseobacterium koreense]|uniref:potassium-transporting ATPase subunit C n=1 Tax=Chryseobacterium koreense TaxID=232216 RepID=UPI0026EC2DE6|nr:potassium-transporting ATPase subunit C [Chryseobacterium koreense]
MKNFIKPAIVLTFGMAILIAIYTVITFGLGKILPNKGLGEKISQHGKTYYANIGQEFKSAKYFHGRPSAVDYNAEGSGGSNKGPNNPEYLQTVKKRIETLKTENPEMQNVEVPEELVTASGSGLDPDISVKGAEYQVKRIAKNRNLEEGRIQDLIDKNTYKPFFGPSKVNVLKLNLALDELK